MARIRSMTGLHNSVSRSVYVCGPGTQNTLVPSLFGAPAIAGLLGPFKAPVLSCPPVVSHGIHLAVPEQLTHSVRPGPDGEKRVKRD